MAILEIISAKRDGKALSQSEIAHFVSELADAKCPPEQAAALAMAIYLNGMDFDETAMLTKAMAPSGAIMDWRKCEMSGRLVSVKTRSVGEAGVRLGGGRKRLGDAIDGSVGFSDIVPVGTSLEAGEPLAFIHAASEAAANQGVADYIAACSVGYGNPDSYPLIRTALY
jgi:thymidine phosphorylase